MFIQRFHNIFWTLLWTSSTFIPCVMFSANPWTWSQRRKDLNHLDRLRQRRREHWVWSHPGLHGRWAFVEFYCIISQVVQFQSGSERWFWWDICIYCIDLIATKICKVRSSDIRDVWIGDVTCNMRVENIVFAYKVLKRTWPKPQLEQSCFLCS